ncbi:MAG TPA: dehydrogenase [Verrucomicrobiales bacterium]|nr:dehydrogenase [Verrucomicrobiales bacterium]
MLLLAAFVAQAQNGDKAGEVQKLLVPEHLIPPSPVLTPEEALRTFEIKPGFRVEIVATEPLVNTPVAMEFDPDGRIWVVEMSGYMPDADGRGEKEPVGTIAVLDDTDGDGRMDKRTVFLDGLVMPRAICLTGDGVIVAEMPNLWLCRDTDGDLKCDEKTAIVTDYVQGDINNPEHNANGLMWGLDNWIYSANYTKRLRRVDGQWIQEPTVFRGQWGLSQDDFGRQTYDTNSDQLRLDLIPAEYLLRNPNFDARAGVNVDPVGDQTTYPIRVTPGINRGYQSQMLRDGRLAKFTAACGPVIYRGDNFPPEFLGNAFVCEPSGNLIKRNILTEKNGIVSGRFAYPDSEFLASTDERFRPVNAFNGPDGALYLVDMYRGLIQHRIYLTSYLRSQVESRDLEKPINHGRIYRIVHEGKPLKRAPKLGAASSTELVASLGSSNGWERDTAQRLLVERRDPSVVPTLQHLARTAPVAVTRVHALWTLDGMEKADVGVIRAALSDSSDKVVNAALRIADARPAVASQIEPNVLKLVSRASPEVRWQLALSLGNYASAPALKALVELAGSDPENRYLREAALSGIGGRELEVIELSVASPIPGLQSARWIEALAGAVIRQGDSARIARLLALAGELAQAGKSSASTLLGGMVATMPKQQKGKPAPKVRAIKFETEPAGFATLKRLDDSGIREQVAALEPLFSWPGKSAEGGEVRPLTETEQALFNTGKELYAISCGACHQPHGKGQEGLAPPLVGSEWVTGSEERLVRVALHGLMGPITVNGQKWDLVMPGLGIFEDEQIAGILTYIRREWDNAADPITTETVKRIRAIEPDRIDLWTEETLKEFE